MSTITVVLFVLATLIIVALAVYAAHLIRKVKRQEREHAELESRANEQWQSRQKSVWSDIQFIASATAQEQCEITESVMRLHYLIHQMDALLWQHDALSALRDHHDKTADMPILEQYQTLSKKEKFELDKLRRKLEAENNEAVIKACAFLLAHEPTFSLTFR